MTNQILQDRSGKKIGEIQTNGDIQTIFDRTGKKLGEYNSKTNYTSDRTGKRVGSGNLLTTLLSL